MGQPPNTEATMLQVRMLTHKSLEDERTRSNSRNAMLPSDLAKPMGITNGTSPGGTRKPRTSDSTITSACVSYRLDDNGNKVDAHIFRGSTTRKPNRDNAIAAEVMQLAPEVSGMSYADRAAHIFATTGIDITTTSAAHIDHDYNSH